MVEERAQRRLAAILAADVVGYSRLMERDEARTLAELKSRRTEILKPLVSRHHGRIVKLTGDGVLVEFASAVNAVCCATELQEAMEAANRDISEDRRIVLRVGINLGDVMVEGGDLYGDGVNIAARLEALADPGSIFLSQTVHDQVRGKTAHGFEDLGEQNLKNMTKPVRVYRVLSNGESEAPTSFLPLPDKPSVAVLPFTNMSGDPDQQYFSDGVTEDIITELSRFRQLFVIARNSSFQYRGKDVDLKQLGRELGVRYVVEGSIRRADTRIRTTAQLIDARTGSHVWAERYDRDLGQLFEVQDEVARTIVATLAGRLEDAEVAGSACKRTDNLAAYEHLLRGIQHIRGYAADDNRLARTYFEQAISLDSRFALAHAYLALALLCENGYGNAPNSIKERALIVALTGLQLDPNEARCHQFLAQVYRYRSEYDLALSHFERSAALNPNDANGLAMMGSNLCSVGRAEEAVTLIRSAMRLNPFHPEWYWSGLGIACYAARRYEDALDAQRRLLSHGRPWDLARFAACYAQLGRLDEARAQAAELLRLKPDFRLSSVVLYYKDPADALHVLDGMRKAGLPE
jgi:TolB-like protein/class 3 adenylate cyclase